MPIVQYINMFRKERVSRSMRTPKRITELRYWLKEAQKTVCEIPQQIAESEAMVNHSYGHDGWFVARTEVDIKWIRFDIENVIGEKAQIVIDRTTGI